MNDNNSENQAVTREIYRICDEHTGCEGCPMSNGDSITIMNKQCKCVTATMKLSKGGAL